MEWYEVIQTIAIILILISLIIILLDDIAKKSTEEATKEKEKTKDNTKSTEPKQITKVVVFDSQRNLSLWFDDIAIKLSQLVGLCGEVTFAARTIKLGNMTILFTTRDKVNKFWSSLPKDALYYLTAEYDLNDNFIKSFYKIIFTSSDYFTVDEVRRILHL